MLLIFVDDWKAWSSTLAIWRKPPRVPRSQRWAVDADKPFGHFSLADGKFRKQLRARGIQAGDRRNPDGRQEIDQLTQELAYEYWHRMLFARFLAENHLLMHPDGVVVTPGRV